MKKFKISDLKIVTFTFKCGNGHIQMFYKPLKGSRDGKDTENHVEIYYTDKDGDNLVWKGEYGGWVNKSNALKLLNKRSEEGYLDNIIKE